MSNRPTILPPPTLFVLPKLAVLVTGLPPADVAAGEAAIADEAYARHVARERAKATIPAGKKAA